MTEPTTVNVALIIPNTGDLVGSWGTTAVNPNMSAIDGMLGGVQTISLAAATTFTLSVPAGSITPSAGPNQSQNALIKFTGTLTGDNAIRFTLPGRYTVHNACTVGSFIVQLQSVGAGNAICAPPGEKVTVFHDGTNMDYADLGRIGSAFDLHGATSVPRWISQCTVAPYLLKDGTVYSTATFPALSAILGSTFGGNGVTTFAVPDESGRMRMSYDSANTGRVTNAVSGIAATTMGAAGGDQRMQQHTHTTTDPGHSHSTNVSTSSSNTTNPNGAQPGQPPSGNIYQNPGQSNGAFNSNFIANGTTGITINNAGSGGSQNMPPTIVSFLALIRAG